MSARTKILSGVFPVVATPFNEDGSPDVASLGRLVEWLIGCGVDGVVFPGVASEVDRLSAAERNELVAVIGRGTEGRVAFVVGASAAAASEAAEFARAGEAAGSAAAMIMAPAAFKGDIPGLTRFYEAIAAASPIPIMLQNAPPPVGAGFEPSSLIQVAAAVPSIRYIKEETMPCGQRISGLLAARPSSLRGLFGGAGGRYILDELARGAVGTMPACELADVHVALFAAWRGGDRARSRELFNRTLPLLNFQAVFRMAMTKEVLRRRGLIASSRIRAPGPRLDSYDLAELAIMLEEIFDLLALPRKVEA